MFGRFIAPQRVSVFLIAMTLSLSASGAWLLAQSGQQDGAAQAESANADPPPTRIPSPEEIQQALTEKGGKSGSRVILPLDRRRQSQSEADPSTLTPNNIRAQAARLLPEGTRVVDRPGRLVRDGVYWALALETRTEGAPELPLRLLPNRKLEDMEQFTDGGEKPVVFMVSGEVTEYRGVNYLLIQDLRVQTDLGNLK